MPRVYFSYAPAYAPFAQQFSQGLLGAGLEVVSRSTLGDLTPEGVEAAIWASDAVVALLAPDGEQSPEVERETALARRLDIRVIQVSVRDGLFFVQEPGPSDITSALGRPPEAAAQAIRDLLATDATPASEERARGITFPTPDHDELPAGVAGEAQPAPFPDLETLAPPAPAPFAEPAMQPPPAQPPAQPSAQPPAPAPGAPPTELAPITGALGSAAAPRREKASTAPGAETLQFSAYHANTLPVENWNTLLVYTAVGDALAAVGADAATFTELGSAPRTSTGQSARAVAQGAELTIEPHMEGVAFSPASETFIWRGGWHRSLFRFQAAAALAGSARAGWVDVYAGPMVPIARIDLTFSFIASRPALALNRPAGRTVTSNIHDTVFISYSHRDREAFQQACAEYARFGITVYTDEHLEAGADYERDLGRMIAAARVFHLLWSPTSARSSECRTEWTAALRREPSERFIKPWFWKQPLTAPPAEFAQHHISFRFQRLRRRLLNPETWF